MTFFKKQAFKIKDLLKEEGLTVPLVTVQEILAKSYGFNNRHVALLDEVFLSNLEQVKTKPIISVVKTESTNTDIDKFPEILTRENIENYRFWWNYDTDEPVHYPDCSPGSPFDEDYLDIESEEEFEFWICELGSDNMIRPTNYTYVYNAQADHFERDNLVVEKIKSKPTREGLTPIDQLPALIDNNNSANYYFYWKTDHADQIHFHPEVSPLMFACDFIICDIKEHKKSDDQVVPTFLRYVADKETQTFQRQNVIKAYLHSNGERTYFKNFSEVRVKEKDMYKILNVSSSWLEEIKRVLQHRDCPIDILEKYAKHDSFFVRIVAIFSKTNRAEMVKFAKADKDVRVRGLYYKYLMSETDMPVEEIREQLKQETPAAVNMVRGLKVNNEVVVNW